MKIKALSPILFSFLLLAAGMEVFAADTAGQLMQNMSLEEKVAQLFIVIPDTITGVAGTDTAGEITRAAFEEFPVGGFVFMENNIKSEEQIKAMNQELTEISEKRIGVLPFLGVDEEGGTVARIAGNPSFPVDNVGNMSDIGAGGDIDAAGKAGSYIGAYLREYGFNVDFAPVADVLVNGQNSVVTSRSFGSDASQVSSMVSEYVEGMEANGIKSVLKHFPGHGSTEEDSHDGFAYSYRTAEEMENCEWLPFQEGIRAGADFVMVSHISVPEITGTEVPASLSKDIVTGILRQRLGFEGLIVTDAMNMGAIANHYSSAEAAVQAIEAGCDLILMPTEFQVAYEGVLEAVESGRIPSERIDESVERILGQKLAMGQEQIEAKRKPLNPNMTGTGTTDGLSNMNVTTVVLNGVSYSTDVEELNLSGMGLTDISFVEYFHNLKSLNLNENEISDLSPLASLAQYGVLEKLYLNDNQITDLTPLTGLTSLQVLRLRDNQITDLTPLVNLTKLYFLSVINNRVTDLMPLQNLTEMKELQISTNQIDSIEPIAGLNQLTTLSIGENQITDLAPLESLTNLTEIWAYQNQITDISPLANLTKLTKLSLGGNQITDLTALTNLTTLTELILYQNQITDITALSGLTQLNLLRLNDNQIQNIIPLSGLTNLTELELENNQITDITPLVTLGNLTELMLKGNPITDYSVTGRLEKLEKLEI